jgi:hypothetical protein
MKLPPALSAVFFGASISLMSCAADPIGGSTPATCMDPDVLAFVSNLYSGETQRPEIVPGTAAQYPAPPPNTVLCSVYVRRTVYDAAKYGSLPKIVIEPRFFRVKTLAHGFEVTPGS